MTNPAEGRELRISDADRDQAAAALREAAGDGRLDLDELDEPLNAGVRRQDVRRPRTDHP